MTNMKANFFGVKLTYNKKLNIWCVALLFTVVAHLEDIHCIRLLFFELVVSLYNCHHKLTFMQHLI